MAYTSGSHSTVFSSKYYLVLAWEETAYSAQNNTSTVSWRLYIDARNGLMEGSAKRTWNVTINGTNHTGTFSGITVNHAILNIASGTDTITHNNDGTKTFSYSYSHQINVQFSSAYVGTVSGSSTGTLTTIPRATTPSLSTTSINIGDSLTITVAGASSGFSHQLTYTFGSVTGTIATKENVGQNATITFQPGTTPATPTVAQLAEQMKNSASGTCTITCSTYSGSTLIGSKSVTLTLNAPSSWKPTVSNVTLAPSRNVFGTSNAPIYANGVDSVVVTFATAGSNSSTVQSATVGFQGKTYSASYNSSTQKWTATTNVSTTTGTSAVTIVAVDSRGRSSATSSTNVSVVTYTAPKNTLTVHRADSSGNLTESGDYMLVTIDNEVSSVKVSNSEKNTRTVTLQYQVSGQQQPTTTTIVNAVSNPLTASNTALIAVANNLTCAVTVTVSDKANSTVRSTNLSVGYCTIDFLDGGRGISFGKGAQNEGFECAMDTTFDADVSIDGNASFNGDIIHNVGETSIDAMATLGTLWSATMPRVMSKKVAGSSTTVNIDNLRMSGECMYVYLLTIISWATPIGTYTSVYLLCGIRGSESGSKLSGLGTVKQSGNTTASLSGSTLTITFQNNDGGAYSIIPLIYGDASYTNALPYT